MPHNAFTMLQQWKLKLPEKHIFGSRLPHYIRRLENTERQRIHIKVLVNFWNLRPGQNVSWLRGNA